MLRPAHPQGIEACRVPAVGKWVEDNVQALIQLEILPERARWDEIPSVRLDSFPFQKLQCRRALAAKSASQNEPRVFDLREHPRPKPERQFFDLAEIVQASK